MHGIVSQKLLTDDTNMNKQFSRTSQSIMLCLKMYKNKELIFG